MGFFYIDIGNFEVCISSKFKLERKSFILKVCTTSINNSILCQKIDEKEKDLMTSSIVTCSIIAPNFFSFCLRIDT